MFGSEDTQGYNTFACLKQAKTVCRMCISIQQRTSCTSLSVVWCVAVFCTPCTLLAAWLHAYLPLAAPLAKCFFVLVCVLLVLTNEAAIYLVTVAVDNFDTASVAKLSRCGC
jgi:hypothetical protein